MTQTLEGTVHRSLERCVDALSGAGALHATRVSVTGVGHRGEAHREAAHRGEARTP
jgi:hypothetical protein